MLFFCMPFVIPLQQSVFLFADLYILDILFTGHVPLHLLQQSLSPYLHMMVP